MTIKFELVSIFNILNILKEPEVFDELFYMRLPRGIEPGVEGRSGARPKMHSEWQKGCAVTAGDMHAWACTGRFFGLAD